MSYGCLTFSFSFVLILGVDDVKLPTEGQHDAFGNLSYTTFYIELFSLTLPREIAHFVLVMGLQFENI